MWVRTRKREIRKLAKEKKIEGNVHFHGYRTDVKELNDGFRYFSITTKQRYAKINDGGNGIWFACVASDIRGNRDLITNGKGGFLHPTSDYASIAVSLQRLCDDKEMRKSMGKFNLAEIKKYDVPVVEKEIQEIYAEVLGET